jgi:hypothetical protein
MDMLFCVILNLGIWLEVFHASVPEARARRTFVFHFSNEVDNEEKAADRTKGLVCRVLQLMFSTLGVLLGSHSIRKFASTFARGNGVSRDDKDHRGRWKHSTRVSDAYDDMQLDYVDAKVAAVLCPGGVCRYIVVDPGCTDDWIAAKVTPHIDAVFGRTLALLFGRALLWCAHVPQQVNMPNHMAAAIRTEYTAVRTLPNDRRNPVDKVLVTVTGNEAVVYMEDIVFGDENKNNGPPPPNTGAPAVVTPNATPQRDNVNGQSNRQLLLGVMGTLHSLRRCVTEHGTSIDNLRGGIRRQERTMASLVRKIDMNPLHQLHRAANNNNAGVRMSPQRRPGRVDQAVDDGMDPRALLTPNPRTLHVLWEEWIRGVGGNKPAREFTRVERGRAKYKYSRRKNVWTVISKMVNAGLSAHEAIERLHQVYGAGASPTRIINCLIRDKRNLPHSLCF